MAKKHKLDPPAIPTLEERGEAVFSSDSREALWHALGNSDKPFKKEYCERLIQFFNIKIGEVFQTAFGPKFRPNALPHFSKFAREIGVSEKQLYEWAEIYPEFKRAMTMAEDMRNEVLKDNALLGNYDSKVATLFLNHYAGIGEKQAPPPPSIALPSGFVSAFDHFLKQRGEKPILLPPVEEAEFTEPEKTPKPTPVVSEMGKDFKKFHEGRPEN